MTIVNTTTGEITEQLTAMERSALTHAEAEIENGLQSFIEVGEALAKVRDERLYREDFASFEAYCRERWGLSRSLAYDTIAAAETVVQMSAIADVPTPVNVGQARELRGLEPQQAVEVMVEATVTAPKPPTASDIREARERIAPRVDHAALADAAVAEFPDLAYYRDEAPDLEHCWRLAESLRTLAARGELDERLGYLRKSIELDRSKRNGTYVPAVAPTHATKTCPTCGQEVN